jgi:hypothetical protein
MPVSRAFSTLRVPDRRSLLQVPQKRSPYVERYLPQRLSQISVGVLGREPLLQVPFTELPQRETLHPQNPFSHLSKVPADESPSGSPKDGDLPTGHLHISQKPHLSGSPVKGALPEAPSTEILERAIPHPQSPFIQLSKSPIDEPSSRFPRSGAPIKRSAHLQSLF